jgi:hypothetical protein
MQTGSEESKLEEMLLHSVYKCRHDEQRADFQEGFRRSIQKGYEGWALMFKGYEYYVNGKFGSINKRLWELLEDLSQEGEAHPLLNDYWALRKLLFAHAKRHEAVFLLNEIKGIYSDRVQLLEMINRAIAAATTSYRNLLNGQKCRDQIQAVALHSLGNLELLRPADSGILQAPENLLCHILASHCNWSIDLQGCRVLPYPIEHQNEHSPFPPIAHIFLELLRRKK